MAQRLTIDLTKNQPVADFVSDKEVGAPVRVNTTIVSKDDQTLVLELEDVEEGEAAEKEEEPTVPADSAAMAVATGKAAAS